MIKDMEFIHLSAYFMKFNSSNKSFSLKSFAINKETILIALIRINKIKACCFLLQIL